VALRRSLSQTYSVSRSTNSLRRRSAGAEAGGIVCVPRAPRLRHRSPPERAEACCVRVRRTSGRACI